MKAVCIKNMNIGEGRPKICVPIAGRTEDEILRQAKKVITTEADLTEWRIDYYEQVHKVDRLLGLLGRVREAIGDFPLLVTFRTAKEGGEASIDDKSYEKMILELIRSKQADLVDIELEKGEPFLDRIKVASKENGVKLILSYHNFSMTPSKAAILEKLKKMEAAGGDIAKVALMPEDMQDVLKVLDAGVEAKDQLQIPCVMIAMGENGMVSRIFGGKFHSSITFASLEKATAPGQMDVKDLYDILKKIYR